MKVTEKDVKYVAGLANLELTDEERSRMVKDLDSILTYIDRLNELDTSSVLPMTQVFSESSTTGSGPAKSAPEWRGDELRPCLSHEAALANAPVKDKVFFKVPKVIER